MSVDYKNFKLAISLIGANIVSYGHFDTYMIPNEEGEGIFEKDAKANPQWFLQSVETYYSSKSIINKDYGDDIKEQNAVKRFLLARKDTEEAYQLGEEWVKINLAV